MSYSTQTGRVCEHLCNILYLKEYDKTQVNSLLDELNASTFKGEIFLTKHDATGLVTALCNNIRPSDDFLAAKASHLVNSLVTKQNLIFSNDYLWKVISWHIQSLRMCSDVILPDILHNLQSILRNNPVAGHKFAEELIGRKSVLLNVIQSEKSETINHLQLIITALKCIGSLTIIVEEKNAMDQLNLSPEIKENAAQIIISLLLKGYNKRHDEFLFCKVVISALRVLSQLYYNELNVHIPLPEVMGICHHFIMYGLVNQNSKPERIMPSQQTIAITPVVHKGGKKQKLRKQRNNAIESLKKEIPVSDRSLLREVDNFDNSSTYKPASASYSDSKTSKNTWALTSDSDMSDVENNREAKLIALRSRVRQSASNFLLILVKVTEKKDMFGFWWALLPDCPDDVNWANQNQAKKTLAHCAITDPVAICRASVLSVILALLSGSRIYLSQAEHSKRDSTSFIPFSVSLGYTITCTHRAIIGILNNERSHSVILVALKCCAALVQSTPYHKIKEGLVTEIVMSTRRYLIHKDITLQVAALVTIGCVISIDPKIPEIIKSIEKDCISAKKEKVDETNAKECDDFEEGYSDDEMFTEKDEDSINTDVDIKTEDKTHHFKSWILDICFKNMGWCFRGTEIVKSKQSAIPVVLESLQVLSATAFHHLSELLAPHLVLLSDILCELLQHDHQDVILQAARVLPVIGDAIHKLDQLGQAPPIGDCVYMWQKLITPLSTLLQFQDNAPIKAVALDCLANVGETVFKELPRRLQVLWCTLLVGSCSDEEPAVRAASVRALAMSVMYSTLRQDPGFVSDCGENVLRALAESALIVRTKAAWALGNLSDALVLNSEDPEAEEVDDDLLLRLLEVSIQCVTDNDKIKMSATRGIGNLLRLIKPEHLQTNTQLKALVDMSMEKLLHCSCKVTNMKVRWNACHALGNAMKNESLFTCFNGWQRQVFASLINLSQECKNLKVRINAASALRSPKSRSQYDDNFPIIWRGIMAAMESAANVDDFNEYKHKDNLIEQLCVTLAYLCCQLTQNDLADILDPLVFHFDCAKPLLTQLCHKLPPENPSCVMILQAAKHVTVDLTAVSDAQMQALTILQDLFIWDL